MHFIHVDDKSGYPHTAKYFFLGNQNEPQLHALTCINLKNSKLRKKYPKENASFDCTM